MTSTVCLVTGGAGFIGSHLVEALVGNGHRVRVLDNLVTGRLENLAAVANDPKVEVIEADLADGVSDAWLDRVERIFHLAALADIVPSVERPYDYHRANVEGTVRLLEAARGSSTKCFVNAASSSCYGLAAMVPTPESAPVDPQYPYAFSKLIAEQYLLHWNKIYGGRSVSLRLFNVYGPRSRTSGAYGAVFGVFLAQKLAGVPFTVVGDGSQCRDFVFVSDVVRAFIAAAWSDADAEVFNVGTGVCTSINRLVELLGGPVTYIPKRPGEPERTQADVSRIRTALDWVPEVSLEEGVRVMIEKIDHWRDAPVWTPEQIERATREWFERLSAAE